jgi:uncharacterized protein YcaQ
MPGVDITADRARAMRMASLLASPEPAASPTDVAGVVEWFGAMQAQDMASGLWSLGARLPAYTKKDVNDALERREALRTWPMRGTVHLVPPRDAHWMLELMAVRQSAGFARQRALLGLDDATAAKALDVLGAALADGQRLSRAEVLATLNSAGIHTDGQRGYHLIVYASTQGVICVAPHVGTEQTFALLDTWVTERRTPSREEGLAIMALRFFRGHGPATVKDFAGWTGLTMADARAGIAANDLVAVRVDGVEMLATRAIAEAAPTRTDVRVLPGFDEYLLGYKDRSLMADPAQLQAIVPGGNGVFQSTVVRDGRVAAIWKRTTTRAGTTVTVTPMDDGARPDFDQAFDGYRRYLAEPLKIVVT